MVALDFELIHNLHRMLKQLSDLRSAFEKDP